MLFDALRLAKFLAHSHRSILVKGELRICKGCSDWSFPLPLRLLLQLLDLPHQSLLLGQHLHKLFPEFQKQGVKHCVIELAVLAEKNPLFVFYPDLPVLSTSLSFFLKMFLSSPNVDSIFSNEKFCSCSAPRSWVAQELSSLTVLSKSFHSLTRVSAFFIHSSETPLTLAYLALSAATSSSASLWVVILLAAVSAFSKIFKCLRAFWSNSLTCAYMALASSRVCGLERPPPALFSEASNQGLNPQ